MNQKGMTMKILVSDLDGTLLNNEQRKDALPANPKNNLDWHEFNQLCAHDEVNTPMLEVFLKEQKNADLTALVTSRPISYYKETIKPLFALIEYDFIFMRSVDDTRPCSEFKKDVFNTLRLQSGDVVLEDHDGVIRMAQEIFGATTIKSNITCVSLKR